MFTPAIRVLTAVAALAAAIVVWFNLGHSNSMSGAPPADAPPARVPAELRWVAMNDPLDDSKRAAAGSLAEHGRIGKVSDAQGLVMLRATLAQRWTPICRETLLKPGDWLRADVRGANAVKARLTSDVELTLGPGTLIELVSPTQARMLSGEAQVNVPEPQTNRPNKDKANGNKEKANNVKQPNAVQPVAFELLAPRTGSRVCSTPGKVFLRVDRDEKLVEVKQLPAWLAGFEGAASNESLGSLIVHLPDGRNEPLGVGYHKVSVEIRDQIARTTIEESFVNHTDARLEGVFHFPLPQDASISGFGMWIGNDLIEADIVEKQRAREIYETILREKRDPGLLEWTSGNLFKARVFPIEAQSEKRVKIVYTQVLPLRANKYRYAYGLRSDLLRMKPVRELSLKVTVDSAIPLKSVTCPTHAARVRTTAHAAQVEFVAQDYSPDRDFEIACETDGKQSDVVVVPHRRGSDGYLLVQLTPPGSEANWQREALPDGAPLDMVLLCDTSGSMDSEKRKQQAEFVAAVLSSLGEKDHFMLAATDASTAWAAPAPLAPTAENIARARDFLEKRTSLGWTNLDQAFEAVLLKAPAGAQVVYIGDGIVSAGDREPASFVKRLAKAFTEKNHAKNLAENQAGVAALHAVTVGNVSESVVMQGIASVGGGSVRAIGGERTAQIVALELLNEIARPGLRDLHIEFRGVKVAAVYPDRLPNLAAGMQQILVARYLPEGKTHPHGRENAGGEIVVTGKRGAEPVRYSAQIDFQDAEEGNSFIPRLWARSHLNHLLAQGSSATIHDAIIGLSEEFHIITPYTSLLVLETDADRERFGVKRRHEMRDGERFFATGKDNANFEIARQQMKRAADWRLGLRRRILRELAMLGRDSRMFQRDGGSLGDGGLSHYIAQATQEEERLRQVSGIGGTRGGRGEFDTAPDFSSLVNLAKSTSNPTSWDEVRGRGSTAQFKTNLSLVISQTQDIHAPSAEPWNQPRFDDDGPISNAAGPGFDGSERSEYLQGEYGFAHLDSSRANINGLGDADDVVLFGTTTIQTRTGGWDADSNAAYYSSSSSSSSGFGLQDSLKFLGSKQLQKGLAFSEEMDRRLNTRSNVMSSVDYGAWVNRLFPSLAAAPPKPPAPRKRASAWSPEAIALSHSLSRLDALRKLTGGIELHGASESFDPAWRRTTSRTGSATLYSLAGWLAKPIDGDRQTVVDFCDKQQRGVFSLAFLLGQTRPAVERDLTTPPFALSDWSLLPLHEACRGSAARVEAAPPGQAKLILTDKDSVHETRFLIDTVKHVLLRCEVFDDGKSTGATTYSDFVEATGSWWAKRQVSTDAEGRVLNETTLEVTALAQQAFDARLKDELAALPTVQFLRQPIARLEGARQRVADGSAAFGDRIAMMVHYTQLQQWDDVLKQLDEAEKLAADKPGMRLLRTTIYATIRRNEEARQRLLDEARRLVASPRIDEAFLTEFLRDQAQGVCGPDELLELLDLLKPVVDRQPAGSHALSSWQDALANANASAGRTEDWLAKSKILAENAPWDVYKQTQYAEYLMQAGQTDAARAWLDKQLARPEQRDEWSAHRLQRACAELYRRQALWKELLDFTTAWIARKPEHQAAYGEHLSALIENDRLDAANALAEQWLNEAQIEGKLAPDQRARLDAAIELAQGTTFRRTAEREQERWFGPLADAARFFVRHPRHLDAARRIMGGNFTESEEGDRLRADFFGLLQTDLERLSPDQVSFLVENTLDGRLEFAMPVEGRKQMEAFELSAEIWKQIADRLRARWEKAVDKDGKHSLGEALRMIYLVRFADTELLAFLREQVKAAAPESEAAYAALLFETLLAHKWTGEIETEAFATLRQLSDAEEPSIRLAVQVTGLHALTDAMLANRQARAVESLLDRGDTDKLARAQLAQNLAEIRNAARTELAKHLADEAKLAERQKSPLADWLLIEQAWLDVRLDRNIDQTLAFCWTKLGEAPPKQASGAAIADVSGAAEEGISPTKALQEVLDAILRQRALATAMNLAARKNADPKAVDRLLKYIDAGMAQGESAAGNWRHTKFQLLVALDRPDDLDRELRGWIRADVSTAPWRQSLALLVAERGKLDEAIQLFEAAEKDRLLTAQDYRALASWYQVRNRREAHERAKLESFEQMPEEELVQIVVIACDRWQSYGNRPLPSELDENVLLAFRALFKKSVNFGNYVYRLRELYGACRDFRLLQMLPDAMLGHSPEQAYPLLQQLSGSLLDEMRNEATADEIVARIKTLRQANRTPTDQRSLDLFEAIVEGRSAEVQNQRGPHVAACLAALRRAFERKWSNGEPRLMADFLGGLGSLSDPSLRDEQLRELRELHKAAPADSRDQLLITADLCRLLFRHYDRKAEAMQTMEAALRGYEQAHGGQWPYEDENVLDEYVSMLQDSGQHAAAEVVLKAHEKRPQHDTQRTWFQRRLWSLYNHALEHDGEVSLGKKKSLARALIAYGLKQIEAAPNDYARYESVNLLVKTFEIAHRNHIANVEEPLRKFAFDHMPAILNRQQDRYGNTATRPISVIASALGPDANLRYIVERMEQWQRRLRISIYESAWRYAPNENAWHDLGQPLADARAAASANPDAKKLEPRVLKLAIAELKQSLRAGTRDKGFMYERNHTHFWAERVDDFAQAADEVYRERTTSGRRALHCAEYLYGGLNRPARAIEILRIAHKDGLLDIHARRTLIQYLRADGRYAESIRLLKPLTRELPDDIDLRTELMAAYFNSRPPARLAKMVRKIDRHFRAGGRWTEHNIAQFAQACADCQLPDAAIGYYNEAIAVHRRANPDGGPGDETLSKWYQRLAWAHAALDQTPAAVDAASAAIVCWSPRHSERAVAIAILRGVLQGAKDLDAYVKQRDEATRASGQDSPLLRKAIGQVYQNRADYAKAVAQFQIASQLQANDKEIRQALVACHDMLDQPREATEQLLALVDFDRHDLKLCEQLADRLKSDASEAERASTSIVEAGPAEAENHQAMADFRERQGRWEEAMTQWTEVAELRRLEPTGLLRLAAAQLHQQQWAPLRQTLDKLQKTDWPPRFATDLEKAASLRRGLPADVNAQQSK